MSQQFAAGLTACLGAGLGLAADNAPPSADPDNRYAPLLPEEILTLASSAVASEQVGLLSFGRLADQFASLGFPFQPAATAGPPHIQLMTFLGNWYAAATTGDDGSPLEEVPADLDRFAILLCAEMCRRRFPSLDLTAFNAACGPDEYGLTHLEVLLLTATVDWAATDVEDDGQVQGLGDSEQSPQSQVEHIEHVGQTANLDTPCTDLLNKLGVGTYPAKAAAKKIKSGLGPAIGLLTGPDGADAGKAVSRTLSVLSLANRFYRLVVMASTLQCKIEAMTANPDHKPGPDEADKKGRFRVTLGVDKAQWQEWQNDVAQYGSTAASRDCLKAAGFPVPDSLDNIAHDLSDWRVDWTPLGSFDAHAFINLSDNDFSSYAGLSSRLQPLGDHLATADLVIQWRTEKRPGHIGKLKSAKVNAQAGAIPPNPVTPATILSGAGNPLGIATGIVTVMSGWGEDVFPRNTVVGTLGIEFHAPGRQLEMDIQSHVNYSDIGRPESSLECESLEHGLGILAEQDDGSYSGEITWDVEEYKSKMVVGEMVSGVTMSGQWTDHETAAPSLNGGWSWTSHVTDTSQLHIVTQPAINENDIDKASYVGLMDVEYNYYHLALPDVDTISAIRRFHVDLGPAHEDHLITLDDVTPPDDD